MMEFTELEKEMQTNIRVCGFIVFLALLGAVAPAFTFAQQGAAVREAEARVYAHSANGFREQYGRIAEEFKQGDSEKAKKMLQAFRLPDARSWFSHNFEADKVPELLQRYEQAVGNFEAAFEETFKAAAQFNHFGVKIEPRKGEPKPSDRNPPDFKPGLFSPTQKIQFDRFAFRVRGDEAVPISWEDTYVYLEGAFRFMGGGAYPFWTWEKARARLAGIPRQVKPIYQVPPVYPPGAKAKGIQGVVRLKAVIAKDGTVKDIEVVAGNPELTGAAVDAVRHWRYVPAKVGGKPIEIGTTIDVVFRLDQP